MNGSSHEYLVSPYIAQFAFHYRPVHHPLVFSICSVGVVANILNILILRRQKVGGAINLLLESLSIAQTGVLITYLCFSAIGYGRSRLDCALRSYGWMKTVLVNVNLNIVFHTISVVHVTILAIYRFLIICWRRDGCQVGPGQSRFVQMVVPIIYLLVPICCTPFYLNSDVVPSRKRSCFNLTRGQMTYTISYVTSGLSSFNFWAFGIVCKLLPCCLIVALNLVLIFKLYKLQQRHRALRNQEIHHRGEHTYNTIAKVLCLIVTLFFLVECPQGLLNLLCGIYGQNFTRQVYRPLGDFFEMLTILEGSVNFFLYCLTSSRYRNLFKDLCCPVRVRGDQNQILTTPLSRTAEKLPCSQSKNSFLPDLVSDTML